MGTNYYLKHGKAKCPECGSSVRKTMHIGKSSGGWCFALHIIPEEGIHSLEDWEKRWEDKRAVIVTEYGDKVSSKEMRNIVRDRKWNSPVREGLSQGPNSCLSEEEFHRKNYSEPGPGNLWRHSLSGGICVKHGEGTWDLLLGPFS